MPEIDLFQAQLTNAVLKSIQTQAEQTAAALEKVLALAEKVEKVERLKTK